MKLKQLIVATLMLQTMVILQAIEVATLNNSASNLLAAKNRLTALIGNEDDFSNQGLGTVQTTVTNNSLNIVYIVLLDKNNHQINSTIPLAGKTYTYIPKNVAKIKLTDIDKKELVQPISIQTNTPYSITNMENKWEVTKLDVSANYSYKNMTNIPLIVKIATNNIEMKEQLNPSNSSSKIINPSTFIARKLFLFRNKFSTKYNPLVSIEVHADLSPISLTINNQTSYIIAIENNQLTSKKAPNSNAFLQKIITNNTGWPMLVSFKTKKDVIIKQTLNDGNKFMIPFSINSISIVPLIKNETTNLVAGKPISISNNKGVLSF